MAYDEYPRHVHKAGGAYLVVLNDAEKAAALKDGWALSPVPAAEAASVADDAQKKAPKAKKGAG